MIKGILEMLELAKGDSELIQIAQGKYYLPENFKGLVKQIKRECQRR